MAKNYYVVLKGNETGIFYSWKECQGAIGDFVSPVYKGFYTKEAAVKWFESGGKETIVDEDTTQPWASNYCGVIINPNASVNSEPESEESIAKIYIATSVLNKEKTKPGGYSVLIDFENSKNDNIEFTVGVPTEAVNERLRERALIEALNRLTDRYKGKPVSVYVASPNIINNSSPDKMEEFDNNYQNKIDNKVAIYESEDNRHMLNQLLRNRPIRFFWKKTFSDLPLIKELGEKAKKKANAICKKFDFNIVKCVTSGMGYEAGKYYAQIGTNNGIGICRTAVDQFGNEDCEVNLFCTGGFGKGLFNNFDDDSQGSPSFVPVFPGDDGAYTKENDIQQCIRDLIEETRRINKWE